MSGYRIKDALKAVNCVVAIIIVLAATDSHSFAQSKLLLGYSSLSSNQTPTWVTKEEGFSSSGASETEGLGEIFWVE